MAPTTPETIAVLTASSNSGKACVQALLDDPHTPAIRAVFRSEAKAAELRKSHGTRENLEIIVGIDAADTSTLVPALRGCTVALLVTPFAPEHGIEDDANLVRNMMMAAADVGVRHIIFAASWTVNVADHLPALSSRFAPGEKLLVELQRERGLTWTVLRGGFFYENFLDLLAGLRTSDEFAFADFCVPANDAADIGRVAGAVAVVGGRGHEGCLYEISGPERLWMGDVARVFGDVLGREIKFVEVSKEECLSPLPLFLKQLFGYLIDEGKDAVPISEDVEKVTGKKAVSLRDWVNAHRADFEKA